MFAADDEPDVEDIDEDEDEVPNPPYDPPACMTWAQWHGA